MGGGSRGRWLAGGGACGLSQWRAGSTAGRVNGGPGQRRVEGLSARESGPLLVEERDVHAGDGRRVSPGSDFRLTHDAFAIFA